MKIICFTIFCFLFSFSSQGFFFSRRFITVMPHQPPTNYDYDDEKKKCDEGNMRGCSNLATLEHRGGNLGEATRLSQKACDGGYRVECTNLGFSEHERGNLDEAARWYREACNGGQGDMRGCSNLGNVEFKKGNLDEAARLFQIACYGGGSIGMP